LKQDTADQEKLSNLVSLSNLVDARVTANRDFRRAIGTLSDDLAYLTGALETEPQSWRQNRAFHIVHVPSFLAIMSMLEDIDRMETIPEDEQYQVLSSIHRAVMLVRDARQRVERSKFTDAKIELDVLAEYTPPPAESFLKPSRFTRTFDKVASASETAWSGAKSQVNAVPGLRNSLQEGVSGTLSRAASAPILAGNLQKTLTGALSDNVTTPIAMRLNAGGQAVKHGVGAGVGLGVVVGVLCPPLLPLTAGGAVLAAMRAWRKEMDKARALDDAERELRIAELKAERKAALQKLTKGASALQMETEELSMTLDAETGQADAVVLKGEYSGRTWSSLSPAEKADTGLALLEGAASLLRIIEIVTSD